MRHFNYRATKIQKNCYIFALNTKKNFAYEKIASNFTSICDDWGCIMLK